MSAIPFMVNFWYILLLFAVLAAIVLVFRKTIVASTAKRKYVPILVLLLLWAVFTVLSVKGVFIDTIKSTVPAFMPAVLATNLLAVYFALFYQPLKRIKPQQIKFVVALQTFRLPLELIFVWLLALNLLPIQMTFEGRNFDVLVGLTAPVIAYFGYHKKALPNWVLVAWNIAGLALLVNIVGIAILSAPTNFQVFTNLPHNTIVLKAPYHFIPFFLVPFALFGHLFVLRNMQGKKENI